MRTYAIIVSVSFAFAIYELVMAWFRNGYYEKMFEFHRKSLEPETVANIERVKRLGIWAALRH